MPANVVPSFPPDEPTDVLLRAVRSGDSEAWARLDARYRNVLAALVRTTLPKSLRARFDVEDLVQSTFLRAYSELDRYEYRGPGSFLGWLSTILNRRLSDKGRRADFHLVDESVSRAPDQAGTPSETIMLSESMARLLTAVAGLPTDQRTVVLLVVFDQRPYAEVAEELGISVSTVQRRVAAALRSLRTSLPERA